MFAVHSRTRWSRDISLSRSEERATRPNARIAPRGDAIQPNSGKSLALGVG
jgi:hypothetical protein